MDNKEEKPKTNKQSKYPIALILLLLSLLGNTVLMVNRDKHNTEREKALLLADSSLSVKLQVEKHLNEAQTTLNKCKTNNDELNSINIRLNNEIAEKRTIIEKITKDNNGIVALRKQLKNANKLRQDCEKQVNAILKDIEDMQSKIVDLDKTLSDTKKENEDLKKKLEQAKKLKVYEIEVMNYKVINGKQRPTVRAKKVNRISVTCMLAENMAADAGSKNVYLVIYDSKKKVLTKTGEKFTIVKTNSQQICSTARAIDFKNEEQKISIVYNTDTKLLKGKYFLEIYTDGNLSGKKEFELR